MRNIAAPKPHLLTAVAESQVLDSSLLKDKLVSVGSRRDESLALLASLGRSLPQIRQALSNPEALATVPSFEREWRPTLDESDNYVQSATL